MEWDGRAKVLMCYFRDCNHVIRIPGQKEYPTKGQILLAIATDSTEELPEEYDAQDAIISLEALRINMPIHCRDDSELMEYYSELLGYLVKMSKKGL